MGKGRLEKAEVAIREREDVRREIAGCFCRVEVQHGGGTDARWERWWPSKLHWIETHVGPSQQRDRVGDSNHKMGG